MRASTIEYREIRALKHFYDLMARTRSLRRRAVEGVFSAGEGDPEWIRSLKNALASLEGIPQEAGKRILLLDDRKKIDVDLAYEITELEKDIFYLENGEENLIEHLATLHSGFRGHVERGVLELRGLRFNCFLTDRDGTINNYCGRYRSSVQSIYNAVFLTRFARTLTAHPIILTSAPLEGPGILDVCVHPDNTIIYAASKGREFVDLSGKRRTVPIAHGKKEMLDRLNEKLRRLVDEPAHEKYSLIGSGLQMKFGQTTIARQDISKSIPEAESGAFLEKIRGLVSEIDPERAHFRIEDTGLDIEVILTVEDTESGPKDFDKAEAVRFLDAELELDLARGPHLVCGDTSSDLSMIEAVVERTSDTWSIFVTRDVALAGSVKRLCPRAVIVPEPDELVTILGVLSTGGRSAF